MNILSIESSCDETAAAIVKDGREILSNVVVSQIDIFKAYGGVIPEIAARSHLEAVLPVVHEALTKAFPGKSEDEQWDNVDAISVTHTPGLLGSLLIGTLTARTLALLHDKPFYPIHHLKSHIYACWLSDNTPSFPLLALVISGGHTQIIRMEKHNDFKIIGTTRDDAVGECFDKVAKILGLPYPGGPAISAAAQTGDRHKYQFPHPKLSPLPSSTSSSQNPSAAPCLDFSFSGLKTAVLRKVQSELGLDLSFPSHDLPEKILELDRSSTSPSSSISPDTLPSARFIADFAASFEQTAIDILLETLSHALKIYPETSSIVFAGGVSANTLLREETVKAFSGYCGAYERAIAPSAHDDGPDGRDPEKCLSCFFPTKHLSGDNAAMVAAATFYEIKSGVLPSDPYSLSLAPRSPIS